MSKLRRDFIILGISALLGFVLAALDGRVSETYFCLETASAVCFAAAYFFAADDHINPFRCFVYSFAGVAVPAMVWAAVVRRGEYFGCHTGKFIGAAFFCGGVIYLMSLLSRHSVGPLRAALGRNMLPAFFGAAAVHRFSVYYELADSFSFTLSDPLCFASVFLAVMALAVFIAANRDYLVKLDSYLAAAMWGGAFAVVLMIGKSLEKDLVPILF